MQIAFTMCLPVPKPGIAAWVCLSFNCKVEFAGKWYRFALYMFLDDSLVQFLEDLLFP